MKSCRRGFTLVETLVGLALFGLVSGVILAVFLMSHRYSRLYRQVSDAHRETVSCMQGISREVMRAHNQTVQAAVNATWFLSSKPVETNPGEVEFDPSSGQLLWHKWLGIWCDSQGEVKVSELPLSGGSRPFLSVDLTSEPTSISPFIAQSRQRRLGASIVSLQFTKDAHLVRVNMTSVTSTAGNPNTRYQLSSSFSTQ